jgi:hypothetical protein
MQYMLLIYGDEKRHTKRSKAKQDADYQAYGAFGKEKNHV